MGNKPIQDCGFFLLAQRYPGLLVVVCVVCVDWSCRSLLCSLAFVGLAVGGFLVFLELFLPLSFAFISLDFLSPLGPGSVGGNTAGGGLSRVGFGSRCCGGSPLFPVLSFVTVGHWIIGRPRNGSVGCLLELPLCHLLEFLVLTLLRVHSAQR